MQQRRLNQINQNNKCEFNSRNCHERFYQAKDPLKQCGTVIKMLKIDNH